ncbi:eIF3l [Fasciola gigantica]|uniref:eIF3l n=1 Tax=Fasciola gigantica TaxID=46835 RepID=A0A504YBR4_FASGI|nr:eIF3l [Fasciola gigantica]
MAFVIRDEAEFVSSFDIGCPKFITPEKPNYAKAGEAATYQLEPQRQQIELFKLESGQQIELLRLRSFLKLYTNMPTSKLAAYLNSTDMHVHMALMAYKYRLRQVTVSDELCSVDSSAVTGPRYGQQALTAAQVQTRQIRNRCTRI